MMRSEVNRERRFEAVCLAIKGFPLTVIALKLGVSRSRAQQMIIQQAGLDFYAQLQLEHGKRRGRFKGKKLMVERANGQLARVR